MLAMIDVIINKEPIELFKILKFEGLVGTGGEAKMVIDEGLVSVNGQPEMRKRRKMVSGDLIEFDEHRLRLVLKPDSD